MHGRGRPRADVCHVRARRSHWGGSGMGQLRQRQQFDMSGQGTIAAKKEQARAIKRILDRQTHQVVGWLYEWNTGQLSVMWKDGERKSVVYE